MDILTSAGGLRPSVESAESFSSALSSSSSSSSSGMGPLGVTLIGQGANLLGNIFGSLFNKKMNSDLAMQQSMLAREQSRWSSLNSPQLTVQGYRQAGLNPASLNGNAASPPPTTFGASAQNGNLFDGHVGSDIAQLSLIQSQQRLNESQARKAEVEAINASEMLPFEKREASSRVLANEAGADLAGNQSWQIKQMTPAQKYKTFQEATWLGTQNRQAINRFGLEMQELAADIALKGSQSAANKAQARQLIHSLALMDSQIRSNDAMSEKTKYETRRILPKVIYQMGVQNWLAGKQGQNLDVQAALNELARREVEEISPEVRSWLHEGERLLQSAASSYMMLGGPARKAIGLTSSIFGH